MNLKHKLKNKLELLIILFLILGASLGIADFMDKNYGKVKLAPGENYTVNIPLIESSSVNSFICGKAEESDGNPVSGVKVEAKNTKKSSFIASNSTDSNGNYCIRLPETNTSEEYNIYVTSANLTLGSNDYALNLKTEKGTYHAGETVKIKGAIENSDARIDNGIMEVNLKYYNEMKNNWDEIFGYIKYYFSIEPKTNYNLPNEEDELSIEWLIPVNASQGRYKFYFKAAFNGKEKTKHVYFNMTN